MSAKRFTFDFDNLYQRYESGESLDELADECGLTHRQLARALNKRGYTVRQIRDYAALYARHLTGVSVRQLAAEIGISDSSLRGSFKQRGLRILSKRELYALWPAEKLAENTAAAHAAVRGRVSSEAELLQRAQSRESKGRSLASGYELQLAELLAARGVQAVTLQKAIGKYNVDLAWDSIAVEIYGGAWHSSGRHAGRFQERTHYILDSGYHLVIIWIIKSANFLLSPSAADYLITFAESARADPTLPCQYRVIRGTGEILIEGCAQDDDFTMKLTRETGQQRITCQHLDAGITH